MLKMTKVGKSDFMFYLDVRIYHTFKRKLFFFRKPLSKCTRCLKTKGGISTLSMVTWSSANELNTA